MKKKILAIILARGGSKALKLKNIKKLNNKPLIYYTIKASLLSNLIHRTIVSTDNEQIRNIAIKNGAEAPFLRPKKYASDTSTSEDAIFHCIRWLKDNENYTPDYIVYLQCTEPFRSKNLIDRGIKKLISENLDSVFAVNETHKNYWYIKNKNIKRLINKSNNYLPRQSKNPIYIENTGLFLISKLNVYKSKKRIGKKVGLLFEDDYVPFVDIHNENDFNLAQIIFQNLKSIYKKDISNKIII